MIRIFEFEGKPLTVVTYKGRPAFIAKEVGESLGYADGGKVPMMIRQGWKEEFEEGVDFLVPTGKDLSDYKQLLGDTPQYGVSYASRLMLLFESGVNTVLLLSRKPAARRLRQFIAREVMPQIARDGQYLSGRRVDEEGRLQGSIVRADAVALARAILESDQRVKELEAKNEELEGDYAIVCAQKDNMAFEAKVGQVFLSDKGDYYRPGEFAKLFTIGIQRFTIGPRLVVDYMLFNHILMKVRDKNGQYHYLPQEWCRDWFVVKRIEYGPYDSRGGLVQKSPPIAHLTAYGVGKLIEFMDKDPLFALHWSTQHRGKKGSIHPRQLTLVEM